MADDEFAGNGAEMQAHTLGRVVWHSSEEEGPPDVGLSVGLGDAGILWAGEISDRAYCDAGEDAQRLGLAGGWWLALYAEGGTRVLGKLVDEEAAHELIDTLGAALRQQANGGR